MIKRYNTICWNCINAVADEKHGCSWSRDLEPIDGWTAIKKDREKYKYEYMKGDSYTVIDCPMYKEG